MKHNISGKFNLQSSSIRQLLWKELSDTAQSAISGGTAKKDFGYSFPCDGPGRNGAV